MRSTSRRCRRRNSKCSDRICSWAKSSASSPAQLIAEAPTEVTIGLGGDAASLNAEPIIAAALKGLLSGFLDQELNYVNAPFIARERGINVTETRSRETTDYINTLVLGVRTAAGAHEVGGAVLGNRALRLIRIDGYRVEAVPEGYFLMLHNRDVPGVVGAVGTMLGQAGINIAGLELGPRPRRRHGAQSGGGRRAGTGRGPGKAQDDSGDHVGSFAESLKPRVKLRNRTPRAAAQTSARPGESK